MRRLLCALLLAAAFAGCHHDKPFTEGTVLQKSHEAAHDDVSIIMICAGYGQYGCTVWVPITNVDHVPEGWTLEVQQCVGSKCKHQWRRVSQGVFESMHPGDFWRA